MGRPVPLWVLVLCLLLGAVAMVLYGGTLKSRLSGSNRGGPMGDLALEIASFPKKAQQVLTELTSFATGDYDDEMVRVPRETDDLGLYSAIPSAVPSKADGLLVRADPSAMAPGWRIVIGAFSIDGEVENAAILISPELDISKIWLLTETAIDGRQPRPSYRKFPHGAAYLGDGSLVVAFDSGMSIQRVDHCGDRLWAIRGNFHHVVHADDGRATVWTLYDTDIAQLSVETGEILRQFSMDDIIAANPMIDILELRRSMSNRLSTNQRNTPGRWQRSPHHLNDVEPLPAAYADQYEGLEAGDLLISARSLNLVFVIDPDSLAVKWWRAGETKRQHDPDWQPDGRITVFNNRMGRDFSTIIAIDPVTFQRTTLFDGSQNDFYSRIRGKHQITPDQHLIVTSSEQGRVFEVDPAGNIVFELINTKPGSDTLNYAISDLKWLPPDAINLSEITCAN